MKRALSTMVLQILVLLPSVGFAAGGPECTPPRTFNDIFGCFTFGNFSGLLPTLVLVGLVTFFTGVLKFVRAGDNAETRQAGRQVMIYGIIILFVMVSYWGFVGYLSRSFFATDATLPNYLPPLQ